MADTHHFRETINAGTIFATASDITNTGALIMRFGDFPAYNQLGPNFEFARLNKFVIEFWPKSNMQFTQINTAGTGFQASVSGTFVTALDQVPVYSGAAAYTTAPGWANDTSNDTNVSSASFVATPFTTSYVRGIQNSREKELYKKHKMSFYPAFYDYIMTSSSAPGTAITSVSNQVGTFEGNNCCERRIKKWVNINAAVGGAGASNTLVGGPLFYGPVYAVDSNIEPTTSFPALFDVRLKYSISFKRLRGI
jgi:hypothetical protein